LRRLWSAQVKSPTKHMRGQVTDRHSNPTRLSRHVRSDGQTAHQE
jgi:hypothetical protein